MGKITCKIQAKNIRFLQKSSTLRKLNREKFVVVAFCCSWSYGCGIINWCHDCRFEYDCGKFWHKAVTSVTIRMRIALWSVLCAVSDRVMWCTPAPADCAALSLSTSLTQSLLLVLPLQSVVAPPQHRVYCCDSVICIVPSSTCAAQPKWFIFQSCEVCCVFVSEINSKYTPNDLIINIINSCQP